MNEIELRDWEHFREYAGYNFGGKPNYVFRGHADRSWKLESTLTRLGKRVSGDLKPDFLNQAQLQNFRMKIRGLRGDNPQSLDENGLWSLGQHHGLCTPLLDWTESIYVAAYFAFENKDACSGEWRTIFALDRRLPSLVDTDLKAEGFEFLEPLHDDNKRITAQAGLFTKIPTNIDLESWLKSKELDKYLIKIHIEDDFRLDAINDLKLMNITASSIYPDLHGASATCNMMLETISDNYELQKNVARLMKELIPTDNK